MILVKGVIFDMDGLMFDTERIWDTFWAPGCRALRLPEPPKEFYAAGRGLAGENLLSHIRKFIPGCDPQQLLSVVWKIADERLAKGVPVKPGLRELLAYLEQQGTPRIVASSSPRSMVECNLQTTGTARYFHDIVCGPDVKLSKPDPAIFLEAARLLGIPPQSCLVLEDSFNGVRAGHAAGCITVMVPDLMQPTPEIATLYTRCCPNLLEVRDLLKSGSL